MIKFGNTILLRNANWLGNMSTAPVGSHTIRLKFREGVTPVISRGGTLTHVSLNPNVWDLKFDNNNWGQLLKDQTDLLEVIEANTTGVRQMTEMFEGCSSLTAIPIFDLSRVTIMTGMFSECSSLVSVPLLDTSNVNYMGSMFCNCSSLKSVPLFNTSNVESMSFMFYRCSSLNSIPLFDTSKVLDMNLTFYECSSITSIPLLDTSRIMEMNSTFYNCYNIQSGALALYQQASTQYSPPLEHDNTFYNCGRDTVTGAAELAQIPRSWGGTGN